jgi:CBS domain containing-hemolysin-like protein
MLPLLIGLAALAFFVIAFLEWERIKNFIKSARDRIRGLRPLKKSDKVFEMLKQDLNSGNYETVYGLYDDETGEIEEGERVKSEDVDERVLQNHKNRELIISG